MSREEHNFGVYKVVIDPWHDGVLNRDFVSIEILNGKSLVLSVKYGELSPEDASAKDVLMAYLLWKEENNTSTDLYYWLGGDSHSSRHKCEACGYTRRAGFVNYCPNCGARFK